MTQDQWLDLAFKVVIIAGLVSILLFIVVYSRLAKWWKNEIGKTIVWKDILLTIPLLVTAVSLFTGYNRLTSHIAGWIDAAAFGAISVVMFWRTRVWIRINKRDRKAPPP